MKHPLLPVLVIAICFLNLGGVARAHAQVPPEKRTGGKNTTSALSARETAELEAYVKAHSKEVQEFSRAPASEKLEGASANQSSKDLQEPGDDESTRVQEMRVHERNKNSTSSDATGALKH